MKCEVRSSKDEPPNRSPASMFFTLRISHFSLHPAGTFSARPAAKFYLDRLCEFISGRTERVNWEDSWLIETVNDDEWAALQTAMKKAYTSALLCLAGVDSWDAQRRGTRRARVARADR